MKKKIIEIKQNHHVVLFSMLDWGLGHTTRCIPILKELLNQGFVVEVAATKNQINFLQKEHLNLKFHLIKGYRISYTTNKFLFPFKIFLQFPRIIYIIFYEKKWVKNYIKQNQTNLIISDNRPGFKSKKVKSIYITHQLSIHTGNSLSSKIATFIHQYIINSFSECWVPDEKNHVLSGKLSLNPNIKIPVHFIGPLTRFKELQLPKKYDIAIILSGPEPSRTKFENILLKQIQNDQKSKIFFLRGLPDGSQKPPGLPENISIQNNMPANHLNELISSSELIVCRSGYSSIMDLIRTRSRAILIPTPGQGEQEYLAKHLSKLNNFIVADEKNFSLYEKRKLLLDKPFEAIEKYNFSSHKSLITNLRQQI